MIRISPILLMLLVAILSACGNLEWPPKSTGIGYSGNEIGLVNSARNTHNSPLTSSSQKKIKIILKVELEKIPENTLLQMERHFGELHRLIILIFTNLQS